MRLAKALVREASAAKAATRGIAALAVGMGLLGGSSCVSRSQYDRLVTEYHAENQARLNAERELTRREGELSQIEGELSSARNRADEIGTDAQARIAQLQKALEDAERRMNPFGATAIEGVSFLPAEDGFRILVEDKLLFDSGSADLKSSGKSALERIGKEIVSRGYDQVRIDGHTDADPIRKTAEIWTLGNHHLAMARALSVYGYLVNDAKVPTSALSLAAYGPNRPLDPSNSPEAKARNRRVEIYVRVPEAGSQP